MKLVKWLLKFIHDYWHGFFLLYYLIVLVLYRLFNQIMLPEHYMYLPLIDDKIPFIKYMIIPYVYWYAYIVLFVVIFAFKDKNAYFKLILMMFVGMTISFLVFLFFPNGQQLRPMIGNDDIFLRIIRGIYATDNPTNSAPSMHTIDAIAVHFAIVNSELFKGRKLLFRLSFGSMIAIIMSTVMIKQHSIIDVIMGIIVATGLYYYFYHNKQGLKLVDWFLSLKLNLPIFDEFKKDKQKIKE